MDIVYGLWQIFDFFFSEDAPDVLKIIVFFIVFAILSSKDEKNSLLNLRQKFRRTETKSAPAEPVQEFVPTPAPQTEASVDVPIIREPTERTPILTPETAMTGIIWSEILSKPRSMRPIR